MWGWASVLWSCVGLSLGKPVPLYYELHIRFSVFLFSSATPLGGTGRLEGAAIGYFLGSDKSPAGSALVTYYLLRADLVKKSRNLWHTVARNDDFFSLPAKVPIFTLRTWLTF